MNPFRRQNTNSTCANYGYQYSDIMLALFCVYLCGGDHIEDITTILNKYLSTAPDARIPSSDTIARGLKELRAPSIAYTSSLVGVYAHDPAMRLNSPLLDMTLLIGLLKEGQGIDVTSTTSSSRREDRRKVRFQLMQLLKPRLDVCGLSFFLTKRVSSMQFFPIPFFGC